MKYKIYRALGDTLASIGLDIKKHELIGVAFGNDIHEVTDELIQIVNNDLKETEEYAKCDVYAYAPEYNLHSGKKAERSRYDYYITGVVSPAYAEENTLVYFPITEENE